MKLNLTPECIRQLKINNLLEEVEQAAKNYGEQIVNRCAEVAECENEGTYGGDGQVADYYVVNKQSILKVKSEL